MRGTTRLIDDLYFGTTATNDPNATFATAYLSSQGADGLGMTSREGLGTESTASPDHAIDSIGNSELLSLKFGKAVTLSSIYFGWTQSDADFSLLAWTGPGVPDPTTKIAGVKAGGLIAAGWTLVGSYGDNDGASITGAASNGTDYSVAVNAGKVSSSYWLIGAFNTDNGGPAVDKLGDAWKLQGVDGALFKAVPEPGSLALVGLALLGAAGTRRHKQTAT